MTDYIISYTPYFKKNVVKEISKIGNTSLVKNFDDSTALISSDLEQEEFLSKLNESKPIFIKHICPAQKSGNIACNLDVDKKLILDKLLQEGYKVEPGEKFAIQARINGGGLEGQKLEYSSKDLEVYIGTYFTEAGGVPVFSDRRITAGENIKVFSIFINGTDFYIGNSMSNQNLNFACDEYRISSKAGGREISRAENKLKEALAKYNINLGSQGGVALDIGAAPGGWTKVLVDHGYKVVAVDPGDLHPDLQNHPNVKHFKCRIEDLHFENYFDIIVNDMNVDPQVTAEIMNSLVPCLKENGVAVVTLKLPTNPNKGIEEGVAKLSEKFNVLSVNSLFHNRQEVTTYIQKKEMKAEAEDDSFEL